MTSAGGSQTSAGRTDTEPSDLTRLDVVGPLLAGCYSDDRWRSARATLIVGGKSNLTYELTSPAGSLIFRRPPHGSMLSTAHDMGREARVQQALAGTAVPVAQVVLTDDGGAIGVPFYVMDKVPGLVIRNRLPGGLDVNPGARSALGAELVDVLAELHAIDPTEVGLADFGRPDGFLERQIRRWSRQWVASEGGAIPAIDELAGRLKRSLPISPAHSIVHGDYRLDNCIIDAADPTRVAAVLDWELSTLGDPLTDLGMLLFYWSEAAALMPTLIQSVTQQPGFATPDEVAQRWSERTGIATDHIDWYRAFAHFKFAVIAAGIAARVRAGAMGGQDFGALTDEITATAESALHLITP